MIHWRSKGLIFSPFRRTDWMCSHASLPIALQLQDSLYRVYFSTRNTNGHSQLGYFEIDINEPKAILRVSKTPCLTVGKLGAFDCDGVYGASIVPVNNELWCYFGGWNAGKDGLFFSSIGLAVSRDGGITFQRVQDYPILSRDEQDHWALLAPFVLKADNGYEMYYVSGREIHRIGGSISSKYDVRLATSKDGLSWKKNNRVMLALEGTETNISRVCLSQHDNTISAWHSVVNDATGYKLARSELYENSNFARTNRFTFETSGEVWDDVNQTYPYVIQYDEKYYMFYNGRNFGIDGIGLAVADSVFN